jgi:hypothetical protein
MNKPLPVSSKLLAKQWREKDLRLHQKKLRQIKSHLEIAPPSYYPHLHNRTKKEQILEGIDLME